MFNKKKYGNESCHMPCHKKKRIGKHMPEQKISLRIPKNEFIRKICIDCVCELLIGKIFLLGIHCLRRVSFRGNVGNCRQ